MKTCQEMFDKKNKMATALNDSLNHSWIVRDEVSIMKNQKKRLMRILARRKRDKRNKSKHRWEHYCSHVEFSEGFWWSCLRFVWERKSSKGRSKKKGIFHYYGLPNPRVKWYVIIIIEKQVTVIKQNGYNLWPGLPPAETNYIAWNFTPPFNISFIYLSNLFNF